MILFRLYIAVLLTGSLYAKAGIQINTAVFSSQQAFWKQKKTLTQSFTREEKETTIGIMPVNTGEYSETISCDSCRWLSANGVQFALENYLLKIVTQIAPASKIQLLIPQGEVISGYKIDLLKVLDSLDFPLDRWFDGFRDELIYRPRDKTTPREIKEKLNRLGGTLGFTHLLIPFGFRMRVFPVRSNSRKGKMEYSFCLIFWNVPLAYPEWVLFYSEKTKRVDLNVPLKNYLDRSLLTWLKVIPEKVRELQSQEPK